MRLLADPFQHPAGRGHQAARRGLGPHLRVLGQRHGARDGLGVGHHEHVREQLARVLEGEVGDARAR